jgi:hypothetical protein
MLILGVLLIAGCGGSDELALLEASANVLPGECTAVGPKVTSVTPINTAEDVSKTSPMITAVFDEEMNPETIVSDDSENPLLTFTLYMSEVSPVKGTVTMNTANTIATFTPDAALDADKDYKVVITKFAKRASDNAELGCSYKWTFKTGSGS